MACLVHETPRGRVLHALDRPHTIVGREAGNDIRLRHASVAGRHAVLAVEGGRTRLIDLGSGSGTRINGAVLTPNVPSTLEPGDMIHFGSVLLTFQREPPPPVRPGTGAPVEKPVPGRRRMRWETPAAGLAFLLAAVLGGIVALRGGPGPEEEPPQASKAPAGPAAAREETAPAAPETPPPAPASAPVAPEPAPPVAPEGELPPARAAPVARCPELLEVDGASYRPARVLAWGEARITAVGADGRRYTFARPRVTKIEDRADLARRATLRRLSLAEADADGRLALAAWCAQRHVVRTARELASEVLALRPADAIARSLLATLKEE